MRNVTQSANQPRACSEDTEGELRNATQTAKRKRHTSNIIFKYEEG